MNTQPSTPSSVKEQFILRFPSGMRNQLKHLAAANRRSMNAELLLLIERGLRFNDHELATGGADGSAKNMA